MRRPHAFHSQHPSRNRCTLALSCHHCAPHHSFRVRRRVRLLHTFQIASPVSSRQACRRDYQHLGVVVLERCLQHHVVVRRVVDPPSADVIRSVFGLSQLTLPLDCVAFTIHRLQQQCVVVIRYWCRAPVNHRRAKRLYCCSTCTTRRLNAFDLINNAHIDTPKFCNTHNHHDIKDE